MSKQNYKVRFHLGTGKHFMQWQIKNGSDRLYIDPAQASILMTNCTLKNRKRIAKRIHAGGNKKVCAWIECEHIQLLPPINEELQNPISFNPSIAPYWRDILNENIDGRHYDSIVSNGRTLETKRNVPT